MEKPRCRYCNGEPHTRRVWTKDQTRSVVIAEICPLAVEQLAALSEETARGGGGVIVLAPGR